MNKQRRKRIEEALERIQEGLDILEEVGEEEQEAFNNLPEGLQESEKGETMEQNIETLIGFIDSVEDFGEVQDI